MKNAQEFVRDTNSNLKLLTFQLSNVRELETIKYAFERNTPSDYFFALQNYWLNFVLAILLQVVVFWTKERLYTKINAINAFKNCIKMWSKCLRSAPFTLKTMLGHDVPMISLCKFVWTRRNRTPWYEHVLCISLTLWIIITDKLCS